jgi:nitrogen fixation/metabolism regulation signal transduction histidine kinase
MMEQLKNERLRLREQNHFLDLLIQASPMGVVITTLNGEISQLNPMGLKMMGVRLEEIMGKKIENIDSPLAEELANISKDQTAVVRLNDANIYKCTHSSFIDRGFHHPFYLIEKMTDEVMRAEKKAYEKVIRMIAHEVNNTTAGITSTSIPWSKPFHEEDMEDICDVMRVCTERCFSMSRFITRFADVVKIPEPALVTGKLNELASMCKRFMEGMCNDRNILLWLECDPKLEPVRFDAALLEQVLVNIIKNAAESIEHAPEGTIQQGRVVVRTIAPTTIEVVDNGPGITNATEASSSVPSFPPNRTGRDRSGVYSRGAYPSWVYVLFCVRFSDGLTRFPH